MGGGERDKGMAFNFLAACWKKYQNTKGQNNLTAGGELGGKGRLGLLCREKGGGVRGEVWEGENVP